MQISGVGAVAGDGVFSKLTPHTVSFIIYDDNLPATMTGDAPSTFNKSVGDTFLIPTQGNMTRTEQSYSFPIGGGNVIVEDVNILLHGWTDGNGLYFPGDTYTMPNSNVTLSAIWKTKYSPSFASFEPFLVSHGDVITITGTNLGSVNRVTFRPNRQSPSFTVVNDSMIRVVVPSGAVGSQSTPGQIAVRLASGTTGIRNGVYQIV
jgi:hypothetical protein